MSAFKADIASSMRNVSYRLLLNLQSMVLTGMRLYAARVRARGISISAKDPKRTFCRRHLVGLEPPMRRMMPAYPPLLDALVLSSGQIIAVGGFGQLGGRGFPVRGGRGH